MLTEGQQAQVGSSDGDRSGTDVQDLLYHGKEFGFYSEKDKKAIGEF